MDLLFAHLFNSITAEQLIPKIKAMGHRATEKTYYTPADLYEDEKLYAKLIRDMESRHFDAVMTINFWPLVARACSKKGLPYIAWSYDSPQNLPSCQDMEYETNYIYLFDKEEVKAYQKKGIDRVFHMLLATDVSAWDKIGKEPNVSYDITLIGRVYESTFPMLRNGLQGYDEGYIKAIMEAQRKIIGYYMIDDLLSEERMASINKGFRKNGSKEDVSLAQLSYSIGSYITYQDRLTLLRLLQGAGKVHLFSDALEEHTEQILSGVEIHGRVDYETKMPQIFKSTKINLNPTLRVIKSGIPQRAFDIMGCKAFMLSSFQPELLEHFTDGVDVACYYNFEDAYEKAVFYLNNDTERERIAQAGYERIKADFTYEKRLMQMFSHAGLI